MTYPSQKSPDRSFELKTVEKNGDDSAGVHCKVTLTSGKRKGKSLDVHVNARKASDGSWCVERQ